MSIHFSLNSNPAIDFDSRLHHGAVDEFNHDHQLDIVVDMEIEFLLFSQVISLE